MSNGSEKELKSQEEAGDESHQLEFHIEDEKYDEVEE